MYYPVSIDALQQRFQSVLPLSKAQIFRVSLLCYAVLLAKKIHLTFIARVLPQPIQQDSRVRWISRLLVARFMRVETVYHPILKDMLSKLKLNDWHLIIDRTPFISQQVDLLIISLNYHKHAIPLVWCEVPFGGAPLAVAVHLLRQCTVLLPPDASVIFHGDTEFGGREMILALQDLDWHFILAQPNKNAIWLPDSNRPTLLRDLPVKRTVSIAHIHLFSEKPLGGLQLVAFPQTRRDRQGRIKREVAYLVTSLPLTRRIKRLGCRRWGAEPMHKDFKSGGLDLTDTRLRSPRRRYGLLIVLALVYLLNTCLGRRLCQTGQRHQIDRKPRRHLSLFRLGWDLMVHLLTTRQYIHIPLRLSP